MTKKKESKQDKPAYKPYVYRRAEDLGIPVVDGDSPVKVMVTDDDVVNAKKANSKLCALARASMRIPGVNAAYFFRTVAFLEYDDRIVRQNLPISVQKEIVSFDRARVFASGVYQLSAMSPSDSPDEVGKKRRAQRRKKKLAAPPPCQTSTSLAATRPRHCGVVRRGDVRRRQPIRWGPDRIRHPARRCASAAVREGTALCPPDAVRP